MGSLLTLGGCKNSVTDIDGNEYKTVKIGKQLWMAENLRTTKYSNGDLIETTQPDNLDITEQDSPKYQWAYQGDEKNVEVYGRLYTWFAVTDSRNICPAGWHVVTEAEWASLVNFFGGESIAATKLKETGTDHWVSQSAGVTNSSGFTALPGGGRGSNGAFGGIGYYGAWWSPAESDSLTAWYWNLNYNTNNLSKTKYQKKSGFSVRCVKDI